MLEQIVLITIDFNCIYSPSCHSKPVTFFLLEQKRRCFKER